LHPECKAPDGDALNLAEVLWRYTRWLSRIVRKFGSLISTPRASANARRSSAGIKWFPVDEFERPGPHAHDDIATSQLIPSPNDRAKSKMSERTPDVGVHVDRSHGADRTPAAVST